MTSYQLYTISDDSGANGSWITLASEQPEAEDSLYITVAESTLLMPRSAEVAVRMVNKPEVADTLTIFQAGTQELYGFPAEWRFLDRLSDTEYVAAWQTRNSVPADEGLGTYSYVIGDESNVTSKFTQVIGKTGDPYVTGAWPGDYWLYEIPAVVPANTLFGINFTARVSATGHKFWMLEYLDGEDWKPVGTVLTTEETGSTVEYTHALTATNSIVSGSFKVKNAATALKVRFRCMANWQSSGAGALTARNGGTSRMTGDEDARCRIEVLGTNVGDLADVTMSSNFVALEGAAESEGTFTFTSSESWVLTTDTKWLEFTPSSGAANEEATVTVKATSANATGALRKGIIVLNAGMSTFNVEVVQGAAGSILSPFISFVGGNYFDVTPEAATYTVDVQTNVDFVATTTDEWITIEPAVATKALVENKPFSFSVAASTGEARTGKIVFSNQEEGLEAVLYVQQKKAPLYVEWLFNATAMADATTGYAATFNDKSTAAGDGGQYVQANVAGNGKITYVYVDRTNIPVNNAKAPARTVGSTGHPFVYGAWQGDYWLFEATDGEVYPAGTNLNISFITRISDLGMKYWMLECWDGEKWIPAPGFTTVQATVNSETITYNFEPTNKTSNSKVDVTWALAAPCQVMQFKYSCVANCAFDGSVKTGLDSHTNRIAGAVGTSPIFKVVK